MNTIDTMTVQVTRTFDASPERVFDAWLNPEMARRFLFATPTGQIHDVRGTRDRRERKGSPVKRHMARGISGVKSDLSRRARQRSCNQAPVNAH